MLSLERCRSFLGTKCEFNDVQVEQLRQDLYALASVLLDAFDKRQASDGAKGCRDVDLRPDTSRPSLLGPSNSLAKPQDLELEERAAIMEYDAGLRREEAEHQALAECTKRR